VVIGKKKLSKGLMALKGRRTGTDTKAHAS
jgi:hypothetical protein